MRHLAIRNVTPDLEKALRAEQRRSGASLNKTVLDLLRRALGLLPGQPYRNGLERLAGGWSEKDLRDFSDNTACFEAVDEDLWK